MTTPSQAPRNAIEDRNAEKEPLHPGLPPIRHVAPFVYQGEGLLHTAMLLPNMQQLAILDRFLDAKTNQSRKVQIVAIDGDDWNIINLLCSNLRHSLQRDYGRSVLVLGERLPPQQEHLPILFQFMKRVQLWGGLCTNIREHASSTPSLSDPASQHGQPFLPPPSPDRPCIYVLLMSPLGTTSMAARSVCSPGLDENNEHFGWLASYWEGHLRPDVMISVHNMDGIVRKRETLRMENFGLKALVVTRVQDGKAALTPQQARRVVFEVQDWLDNE